MEAYRNVVEQIKSLLLLLLTPAALASVLPDDCVVCQAFMTHSPITVRPLPRPAVHCTLHGPLQPLTNHSCLLSSEVSFVPPWCSNTTHRHTHTVLTAIFPDKHGLAGCSLEFSSPFIPFPFESRDRPKLFISILITIPTGLPDVTFVTFW